MKKSIRKLYWEPKHKLYAISIFNYDQIHDPMGLLPCSEDCSENDITLYECQDTQDAPEALCSMPLENFLIKYPKAISLFN